MTILSPDRVLDPRHETLSFGDFTLDLARTCLLRGGTEVKLRPKSFDVLRHLVVNSRRLVTKNELLTAVWPDVAVTDGSLVQAVIDVRRALGDGGQQIVRTVPRRGYIFEAVVVNRTGIGRELEAIPQTGRSATRPGGRAAIRSLAVLPLLNLSGDPAQEHVADGMTEALISHLARLQGLNVISRTSVMRYKGSDKSLPEIGSELHVDVAIEGAVQRSAGRVRVTVQLIDAQTDVHLWSRHYDRELTNILDLEAEIARAVAEEIRGQLTAQERARLASHAPVDPDAHEAYLLGRWHLRTGDAAGLQFAIDCFQRAVRIAPDYAGAYAGLSYAWLQRGLFGADVESPARESALKATTLDETLSESHISLAYIKLEYDWDWAGSEREFGRALELEPGSSDAHLGYGILLMELGRHDEAISEGRLAEQLDPLSSDTESALGWFLFRAGRYEHAIPHLKRSVRLEAQNGLAHFRLGIVLAKMNRPTEAIPAFDRARERMGEANYRVARAFVDALNERPGEARESLESVEAKAHPYGVASVYAALGDASEAFRVLDEAVRHRRVRIVKDDPLFEALYADPRWEALVQRMSPR